MRLNAAFAENDRSVPLCTGAIRVPGIELDVSFHEPGDIFRRMCEDHAFDVSEMSLGAHGHLIAAGDAPFVGIPAFPSRAFRHAMVFVNADAGIDTPADLNGRRIGVREWGMTAVVWIVGILGEHYGFDLHSARWLAAQAPRVGISTPRGMQIQPMAPGESLSDLLECGDLDAALLLSEPECMARGSERVRRLFPEHAAEERAWFARTGLHPVMHTVVLRRALHLRHPWMARRLYDALCQAREHAREKLLDTGVLSAMLPFLAAHVEETRALFGDDFWPYGIEPNRAVLECLLRYAHQQALTSRLLSPAELFAPEFSGD